MQTKHHTINSLRLPFAAVLAAVLIATLVSFTRPAHASSNPGFVLYSAQGYDHASVTAVNATKPGLTVTS